MKNNSVDFAIITALRVERDAVRERLDTCEIVQDDFDPLTYYYGRVNIPGSDEYYTVVLVGLLNMGNNSAAVATTRLLQRWETKNLMMVGIAGGVREKVDLGDVVVSQFCHYYEMAKLTDEGNQQRPEQFPCDRLLFGRAYAYEASEWKGQIRVVRPGTVQVENSLPNVHFGPIASGEKVIADAETLPRLLRDCPKLLAVAMEGAGVARAATSHTNPPRFLEIRGISDFADAQKNDNWHVYAANAAAAFAIGLLHSRPIPPLTTVKLAHTREAAPLLILCAKSLRPIAADEVIKSFGDDLGGREVETAVLDFTDLVSAGVFTSPEIAVQRLTQPQGALFGALARRGDAELVFHGIVHIPLAILVGHLITDRQPVRFFDFHPSPGSNTWSWPGSDEEEFPPLNVTGLPDAPLPHNGDVVIRVSVSYAVLAEQTRIVTPSDAVEVDLTLPNPERSIVRSSNQTREYGRVFRRTMDLITQRIPNAKRVHLFYSGPVSLAFHIGQQISENIHPPVIAWNFHRRYDWAIDLAAAYVGEECVVWPKEA
ncbi:putative nucleoside phosphorylase (plasmid) [Calothrix sp. NIES-4071]|nr:putative nucleoside phosphorylase [Calothrix sp. NIES-4071]BAZ65116.1 putative nucleoside phosphorylase [Calothrix sp. NIES-4105]